MLRRHVARCAYASVAGVGLRCFIQRQYLHFMSTACVEQFFRGAGAVLANQALLVVYGPFNYGGEFTSPSNAAFDQRLKSDDPLRGIRDFEWVDALARAQGWLCCRMSPCRPTIAC